MVDAPMVDAPIADTGAAHPAQRMIPDIPTIPTIVLTGTFGIFLATALVFPAVLVLPAAATCSCWPEVRDNGRESEMDSWRLRPDLSGFKGAEEPLIELELLSSFWVFQVVA